MYVCMYILLLYIYTHVSSDVFKMVSYQADEVAYLRGDLAIESAAAYAQSAQGRHAAELHGNAARQSYSSDDSKVQLSYRHTNIFYNCKVYFL